MITKAIIQKMFNAASMQRWNDKIRPVELRELDKQAHKMIIAFILGKIEEHSGRAGFDWIRLIEGGIFEFFYRTVLTDLKPQLFDRISENRFLYAKINEWVVSQIEPVLKSVDKGLFSRFEEYILAEREDINKDILGAAHAYATDWEFSIIERFNPQGFEINEIKRKLGKRKEKYRDLRCMQQLAFNFDLKDFINLCGELRFQIRWSHVALFPRTSVLGHLLIVAILVYLLSIEVGACEKRIKNNFFTGLFHDLPEVLTRDIIDPIKRSVEGLGELIKDYEKEEMEKKIYKLLPDTWHPEIRMYTESEFENQIEIEGRKVSLTLDEINQKYNHNLYNPRDGELVRVADHIAAFMEAQLAVTNGIQNRELLGAIDHIKKKYENYSLSGISFYSFFNDFAE
ncbi:MAG: HD domain-containing protein [Candidatus Aminicenantes bacterium]|nr:HD domain-containing protein [Candidatus Aminicenantes bacterium]